MAYLKKKSFKYFFKSALDSSFLWFCLARNKNIFLSKCHTMCPICLTLFVFHFSTFIYVSILNLWGIYRNFELNWARYNRFTAGEQSIVGMGGGDICPSAQSLLAQFGVTIERSDTQLSNRSSDRKSKNRFGIAILNTLFCVLYLKGHSH